MRIYVTRYVYFNYIFSPPGCNLIYIITVCVNGCVSASYTIYFDRLWAQLPGHIFIDRTKLLCTIFGSVLPLGDLKQLEDTPIPHLLIEDEEDRFFPQLQHNPVDF